MVLTLLNCAPKNFLKKCQSPKNFPGPFRGFVAANREEHNGSEMQNSIILQFIINRHSIDNMYDEYHGSTSMHARCVVFLYDHHQEYT